MKNTIKLEAICLIGRKKDPEDNWEEELEVATLETAIKEVKAMVSAFNSTSEEEDHRVFISCDKVRKTTVEFFEI